MPKDKKRSRKESTSDSDSGPDDRVPVKKDKKSASSSASASGSGSAARGKGNPAVEGQEPTWELGKMKKVKVREWRGQTFIDIREYYVDKNTMDTKPGKKGISLSALQYQELKAVISEIDAALP